MLLNSILIVGLLFYYTVSAQERFRLDLSQTTQMYVNRLKITPEKKNKVVEIMTRSTGQSWWTKKSSLKDVFGKDELAEEIIHRLQGIYEADLRWYASREGIRNTKQALEELQNECEELKRQNKRLKCENKKLKVDHTILVSGCKKIIKGEEFREMDPLGVLGCLIEEE
jgi:hypothetical protein